MRIGVDGGCWANDRGYGRYAREMLTAMVDIAPSDEFVFFLDPASSARFELERDNVRAVDVEQSEAPTTAAAADGSRSVQDMLRFSRAVWHESPDVFFCPSVYTYFPIPPRQRAVVAIHDAIAERFASKTLPSARARIFWNAKVKLAVHQANLILSVSDYAADDVSKVIGVPRDRIRVAVEAPAAAFRPTESTEDVRRAADAVGLPDGARWFVYVGGFSPHKNLDVLIRAFASVLSEARSDTSQLYLLLVGKLKGDVFHLCVDGLREVVDELGLEDRVLWPGFVPDGQLRHLHAGALALVLPSDCEGFGLPAVEAAACGAPVIATTESPLPDLLLGGGIFVDPGDQPGLAAAMRRMLDEPETRCVMAEQALVRASALSWERCARDALAAIHEARGTRA